MNITQYFEACKNFDWYYSFSDDGRVYSRESANEKKLVAEYAGDPVKEKIFKAWSKYMFSGKGWSTPQASKPELENYYD